MSSKEFKGFVLINKNPSVFLIAKNILINNFEQHTQNIKIILNNKNKFKNFQ